MTAAQDGPRRRSLRRTFALSIAGGLMALLLPACGPATITATVNSTGDGSDARPNDGVCATTTSTCTLRAALEETNSRTGTRDTIRFAIGSGAKTIVVSRRLPSVTDAVVLDASTQPGWAGQPLIEVDGSAGGATDVLEVAAGNSVVRGFVLRGPDFGLTITGGGGNVIEGNWIGLTVTGAPAGITQGLNVGGTGANTIGGTTAAAANVVAGNNYGVALGSPGNRLIGNRIGTNPSGTAAVGNRFVGVSVSSSNNVVGGPSPQESNLISGNGVGVQVSGNDGTNCDGGTTTGVVVQGNQIGTNLAGTGRLPNTGAGVAVSNAPGTRVLSNLIGGNSGDGVVVSSAVDVCGGGAQGVRIETNRIGTDAFAALDLGNGGSGVRVVGLGADGTSVGGTGPGAGNRIAFNRGGGIVVSRTIQGLTGGLSFVANLLHSNVGLGIDLGANGVSANDAPDADGLQNYPVLTDALEDVTGTRVTGELTSRAGTYAIDMYASPTCDESGYGEGRQYIGRTTVSLATPGTVSFAYRTGLGVTSDWTVTATATSAFGQTSELSGCRPLRVAKTADPRCHRMVPGNGRGTPRWCR